MLVVAVVTIFLASGGLQVAGYVVTAAIVAFPMADQITVRAGTLGLLTRSRGHPPDR